MQKKKIGISVYPEQAELNETINYLNVARSYGYEILFVSFIHMMDKTEKDFEKLLKVIKHANDLDYYIIADFHYPSLEKMGIPIDDFKKIYEMGISCVRFDSPALASELSALTHNVYGIDIQLNMSNNDHLINNVLDYKPVLTRLNGCHNFYPQKNTGLPFNFFKECNVKYIKNNLETSAFIGSHFGNQGPAKVNAELPTIELIRDMECDTQAKFLFYTNEINNVLFGNSFASEEELKSVASLNRDEITFKINLNSEISAEEKEILYWNKHFRRGDITESFIRSTMSRVEFKDKKIQPRDNTYIFNRGDVVIVNENGASYKGELHIILNDNYQDKNKQYNLVGKIATQEMLLLNFINPWTHFQFENKK
ncbi:DUF871 domain-containing protein [Mesoplasma florum]|uniref:DUF871 domain-containing protein n=1 Tax=Mesoplasma florum TaxID=2151 RepID=UPI00131A01F9|nr:MupG family TIM beta-alpha barrel fold protein [Mesoplasma florum]